MLKEQELQLLQQQNIELQKEIDLLKDGNECLKSQLRKHETNIHGGIAD